jgi:hypothetical protein
VQVKERNIVPQGSLVTTALLGFRLRIEKTTSEYGRGGGLIVLNEQSCTGARVDFHFGSGGELPTRHNNNQVVVDRTKSLAFLTLFNVEPCYALNILRGWRKKRLNC